MRCQENSGFLFAHPCERPAAGSCATCQKPTCAEHQRAHDGKQLCMACYKSALPEAQRAVPAVQRDPYLYASSAMAGYVAYDLADHSVFDQRPRPRDATRSYDAS